MTKRMPAKYRMLECICEKAREPMLLTYSKDRGFFEPITNRQAEPVVGAILAWRYTEPA